MFDVLLSLAVDAIDLLGDLISGESGTPNASPPPGDSSGVRFPTDTIIDPGISDNKNW